MFSPIVTCRRHAPAAALLPLILALLQPGAAPAADQLTDLTLRPHALVHGKTVTLGDVAVVGGPAAARMGALPVAAAPLAGYTDSLSRSALEGALRAQPGFADAAPRWQGAERVLVRRAAVRVDGARIGAAARQWLEATHAAAYTRLELTALGPVPDLLAPEGALVLRPRAAPGRLLARTTVWIDVLVDGAVVRSAAVPFQANAWNPVLVARRALAAGAALVADDLHSEARDVLAMAVAPAAAPSSWQGVRLAAPLAAGEVLPARALVAADSVQRGDRVRLVTQDAALRIETAAVAQEHAVHGAPVRVLAEGASAPVSARVVGPGLVAIGEF